MAQLSCRLDSACANRGVGTASFLMGNECLLVLQVLLTRASQDYPKDSPPPLRFIRSCSSSLAAATLHKLEDAFGVPVLEVRLPIARRSP